MRGRCWRSSASTIRRSKPPTPPCRARPFWGRRRGPRRRPSPATGPVRQWTRLCFTRTSVIALDPARGVNNGSPSLHAKLLEALGPKPGEHIVHVGAGAGLL